MKKYAQDLKTREFYKYDCGRTLALSKLDAVYAEIREHEDRIQNFGHTAEKFGNANLIDGCVKQAEAIKVEMGNMKMLWDHISLCQQTFVSYLGNTWSNTDPFAMEDEVKKLMKTVKDMKVDKRANAYIGILDEIKKWIVLLPLIGELRDPAMRDRHWDAIRNKVKKNF